MTDDRDSQHNSANPPGHDSRFTSRGGISKSDSKSSASHLSKHQTKSIYLQKTEAHMRRQHVLTPKKARSNTSSDIISGKAKGFEPLQKTQPYLSANVNIELSIENHPTTSNESSNVLDVKQIGTNPSTLVEPKLESEEPQKDGSNSNLSRVQNKESNVSNDEASLQKDMFLERFFTKKLHFQTDNEEESHQPQISSEGKCRNFKFVDVH